jgi:alpha-D-ribose 1-methylphosphonate 5-triphosphate synthase subunit PhnH
MTTLVKIDPVWTPESQQTIFRSLLTALSFPGRVQDIAKPLAGSRAVVGILAALVDERVTVADPDNLLTAGERRLLSPGAFVPASEAEYVLLDGSRPPATDFAPDIGTIYRPETGTMLLLTVTAVSPGCPPGDGAMTVTVSGPGVETENTFAMTGLDSKWLEARERWCSNFPTGCDMVFCDTTKIVAIPRTSTVQFAEGER